MAGTTGLEPAASAVTATTTYNLLDSKGTDSPFLISNEFFDLAYQAQIGPRFGENCCTLTILSNAERIRRLCSPDQSTHARLKEARFAAGAQVTSLV
jgi:hypothetical protein